MVPLIVGTMNTTRHGRKAGAAERLLAALDKALTAFKELEQARSALERETARKARQRREDPQEEEVTTHAS